MLHQNAYMPSVIAGSHSDAHECLAAEPCGRRPAATGAAAAAAANHGRPPFPMLQEVALPADPAAIVQDASVALCYILTSLAVQQAAASHPETPAGGRCRRRCEMASAGSGPIAVLADAGGSPAAKCLHYVVAPFSQHCLPSNTVLHPMCKAIKCIERWRRAGAFPSGPQIRPVHCPAPSARPRNGIYDLKD